MLTFNEVDNSVWNVCFCKCLEYKRKLACHYNLMNKWMKIGEHQIILTIKAAGSHFVHCFVAGIDSKHMVWFYRLTILY